MKRIIPLVISIFILLMVFAWVDTSELNQSLRSFSASTALAVFVVFLLNIFVVIFRYWRVLTHFGYVVPFFQVVKASVSANIASLLIIPLIGQVAGRQAILNKIGITPAENAAIAAYERLVVGTLSGFLAFWGGVVIFSKAVGGFISELPIIEVSGIVCASLIYYFYRISSSDEKSIILELFGFRNVARICEIYLISLLSSVAVLFCFYFLFKTALPNTSFIELLSAAAIVSFLAGLPISFGGWGLREVSSVYIISHLGGDSATALAASIMMGGLSILATLSLFPLMLMNIGKNDSGAPGSFLPASENKVEHIAIWGLTFAVALFVLFQIHVQLDGAALNVNLADPFAILIFTIVLLQVFFTRSLPLWNVKFFNASLLLITLSIIFSYAHGWYLFGRTGWATGKVIGWMVLLGYLFSGFLVVSYLGFNMFIKLMRLMLIVMLLILTATIFIWFTGVNDLIEWDSFYNILEGYSGNRNALAFQILALLSLALPYQHILHQEPKSCNYISLGTCVAVMAAAMFITGSRSGIAAMIILFAISFSFKMAGRKFLAVSLSAGFLAYIAIVYGYFAVSTVMDVYSFGGSVSSPVIPISPESSDAGRWLLIIESFSLWLNSPFYGSGLGAFYASSADTFGFKVIIHNTPLWILAEFGLLGFIAFLLPFVMLTYYAFFRCQSKFISSCLILLLATFGMMSLFHEVLYQRIFWFFLGALVSSELVFKNRFSER